ncbi:MAG: hypothetical protein B1H04_00305 [Planctomycetales bacterium 4484_123]|nr:MAG: hypothetical protein B1H04_00305 [Planctomycetales bacterium 4484_123]
MNSKERVRAAIARQVPDRVPLGFYAVDYDIVERVLGHETFVRNKVATHIALWQGRRDEVAESLKADTVALYRKLDCADIILPKEAHVLPPADYEPIGAEEIAPQVWRTGDGRVWRAAPEVNEIRCVHDPTARAEYTVEQFDRAPDPPPPDDSCFEAVDHLLAELGAERYIPSIVPTVGLVLLGGMENGLLTYALAPEVVHAAARQQVRHQDKLDEYYIRPGSAGVMFDNDMAGTRGPLISPEMFRRMVLPYFEHRARRVKTFRDQLILHNCGNNVPLMEMFIEAGVDCYQSLQTGAGMEVGRLKELFGDRLCFWGGVAVEVLIDGEPEDVRREVRTAMERGAPGGGFILGPSHSVAKNTKYDNFMAMLDEFVKLRDKF